MDILGMDDFDQYIFLLSSDWCFPYLSARIGLTPDKMKLVQQAAREAVTHIMSSCVSTPHDYLYTEMSISRKQKTWTIFANNLSNPALFEKVSNFIKGRPVHTHEESGVLNIFLLLLEDCINPQKNLLDISFLAEVEPFFVNLIREWTTKEIQDSDNLALKSNSSWDKYLISVFPDVPTALADFYDIKIANAHSFESLWSVIREKIPESVPPVCAVAAPVRIAAQFFESFP